MKTLLLALTLTLSILASQADEAKPAKKLKDSKDSASCCTMQEKQQVKATKAKDDCCAGSCSKEKQVVKLMSPKAAADMGR
jgi:hypothetical protein